MVMPSVSVTYLSVVDDAMLQFHDSWKSLCDWLDVQEQKLRQSSTNTANLKHDLEQLQVPSSCDYLYLRHGVYTFIGVS